jgi:dTDP-4-dehydrorhamnose reductase
VSGVRWLVTGSAGLLGSAVVSALARLRPEDVVTAASRAVLDLRNPNEVRAVVPGHDVVVSCAAFTAVDAAQDRGAGAVEAVAVNVDGAGRLAVAARAAGARMLHVSTDYVVDGLSREPYTEDLVPAPVQVYGASKLGGELLVLDEGGCVVRTAWLHDGPRGRTFVATMAARARGGEPAVAVADQVGSPTWVTPLAERLVALGVATDAAGAAPTGVLHLVGTGAASRFEQAQAVYRLCGADPGLVAPTTRAELGGAPRPAYSALADTRSATYGLAPMAAWDDELAQSLAT